MGRSNNREVTGMRDSTLSAYFRGNPIEGARQLDTDMNEPCQYCYEPIALFEATSAKDFKELTYLQWQAYKNNCFLVFISHGWQQKIEGESWTPEDGKEWICYQIWDNQGEIVPLTWGTWNDMNYWRQKMTDFHQNESRQCVRKHNKKATLEKIGRKTAVTPADFVAARARWQEKQAAKKAAAQPVVEEVKKQDQTIVYDAEVGIRVVPVEKENES